MKLMTLNRLFKGVIVLAATLALACILPAQTPAQEHAARERLAEKGITEEELRVRLLQKGWDVDNLDPNRLGEFQQVLEQTIRELEAEKVAQKAARTDTTLPEPAPTAPEPPKPISAPAQKPAPPTEREEADKPIVYGQHLFQDRDIQVFQQSDRIRPPDTYVLGTGDLLLIQIFGAAQLQRSVEIDEHGNIQLENQQPRISLGGMTLGDARNLLRQRLRRFYTYADGEFSVSVQRPRTITVNFYGEVSTTGSITIPAVNTLFNALAAAGGPTTIGSVREIRLLSGNDERTFDLYKFMNDPRVAESFYLRDNDYVHIPVARRVVSLDGAVRRPFRYELSGDENLRALLEYAGGANPDAYLRDVQITRYAEDLRVVASVDLRALMEQDGDYILYHGDEVRIGSLDEEVARYVEISGAVVKEGKYEFREGMRVADLIDRSTLRDDANREFAYLLRYNPNGTYAFVRFDLQQALADRGSGDNILLFSRDIVSVPEQSFYADDVYIAIDGSVRAPGRFSFNPDGSMRVQDALFVSGGLMPSAAEFGYIIRRRPDDPKVTEYLPFNAQIAMTNPRAPDNLLLRAMDSLYVFDKASFRDAFFVRVSGAVRQQGRFPYDANMTVEDALRLAGGLTFNAAASRIDISRVIFQDGESTRITSFTTQVHPEFHLGPPSGGMPLMPFDHIIVREVPEFQLERTVFVSGEVRYPGVYSILGNNEKLSSFIQRAGGLTGGAYAAGAWLYRPEDSVGVVIIDLATALARPASSANIILDDNDTLYIPKRHDLVTISGAVNFRDVYRAEFIEQGNRINIGYEQNRNAKYYIDTYAAGIADNGRKRLITVRHANGRLERTKNFGIFKSYPRVTPGSDIHVGAVDPRTRRDLSDKEPVDWGNVIRDTLAQATAVLTLVLLLERIN